MATKHDTMTMLEYEHSLINEGKTLIAGVDEVGRGPLAGPVVVACVIMPLEDSEIILGVNDSKKLSEKKREMLYEQIIAKAKSICIKSANEKIIDQINILEATKMCMRDAINDIQLAPDVVLVDAVNITTKYPIVPIIKGDAKSYSIACASIVAKVVRDRYMAEQDAIFPQYGFASNKGYGSAKHISAIKEIGPCPIHRNSFIKNFVGK